MKSDMPRIRFPHWLAALAAVYFLASLAHFSHNAAYIAFYPGLPRWITPENVWLAWLGITGIGVVALLLAWLRRSAPALAVLGIYGAFGLDGLAHYTLALCSEHTFVANLTIWSEAGTGLALLLASALLLVRRLGGMKDHVAA